MIKVAIRNSLGTFFRSLPYFKGKYRLGPALIPLLTNYQMEEDCLVTLTMQDGSIMRLDLRSFTEQRAFFTGEYDGGIVSRISSILTPGSIVLDVGANVGFYSIALGRKLQKLAGGSQLWALEPVKSNFERLVNLVEINNLEETVKPIRTALGNQEGEIQLQLSELDVSSGSKTGNAFWLKDIQSDQVKSSCSSPITKLDSFVTQHNIKSCDLIKVDIEGAELEFLKGGLNFIPSTRPVIYGEFSSFWLKEFGYSFLDIAKLAKSWDYNLYQQVGRKDFIEIKEPQIGMSDVLMVPQEKPKTILKSLGVK